MTVYHRPGTAAKLFNRIFGFFAGAGLTPARNVTLETRGRRSGQTRSVPVNIVEYEGHRYLVSPRGETQWVRNVRAAGGRAKLRHGKTTAVQLEEVPASERAPIIQKYLGENIMSTRQQFGIDPKADMSEFERIAPLHPVFRIEEPS